MPTSWALASSTCCTPSGGSWWYLSYLTGTSSYSTVINTYTWNLPGQATQVGANGVSLTGCAQFCITCPSCYAW